MGGRRAQVLLVEDELVTRHLVRRALVSEGYRVTTLEDSGQLHGFVRVGLTVTDVLHATDLIVCSVRMRGLGGLDLVQVLRGACWQTPVVLLTEAWANDSDRVAESLGAVLVAKPVDLGRLRRLARQVVPPVWGR